MRQAKFRHHAFGILLKGVLPEGKESAVASRLRPLLTALVLGFSTAALAQGTELSVSPVPLAPGEGPGQRLGQLVYLGGLEVSSGAPGFGGWSDGTASPDLSHMLLISDRGHSVALTLLRDPESGAPVGLEAGALEPLLDQAGAPVEGPLGWDAEALADLGEGRYAVGFEQDQRIWLYDKGLNAAAGESIGPTALADLPPAAANSGVEALALSPDGSTLVAILEGPGPEGPTRAFFRRDGHWSERPYRAEAGFGVTAAAFLEDGDLLALERFYSRKTGPLVNLRRIAKQTLEGEGVLEGEIIAAFRRPMSVDNFEILLTGRDSEGQPLVLIASDDNFNPEQRFLVLLFRLLQ